MAGGRAQRRARRPKPSAGELLTEIIPEQRGAGAGAGGVAAARRGQAGEGEADGFSTARNREWGFVRCSFHGSPHCVICSECRDHRDLELWAP